MKAIVLLEDGTALLSKDECSESEAFQKLIKYSTIFLPHEEAGHHTFKANTNNFSLMLLF
jgi:hypothetical protein